MAKNVTDAAIMLGALEGARRPIPTIPPRSPATAARPRLYRFLNADGLKGARIGIPRAFYYDKTTPPGAKEARGGLNPEQLASMAEAIEILKQQGAIIVDPADIPSVVDPSPDRNFLLWGSVPASMAPKVRTRLAPWC